MASRRRLARIAVMQTLFEQDFSPKTSDTVQMLHRNIAEQEEEVDIPFAESLLQGIEEHADDIRRAIQEHAPQWPLDRMDRISRALLMIGAFELLYSSEAPPAVVMNEAIDIAKDFGEGESGKFVNGVLNAIAHN
jgi:N utilization substance protein B